MFSKLVTAGCARRGGRLSKAVKSDPSGRLRNWARAGMERGLPRSEEIHVYKLGCREAWKAAPSADRSPISDVCRQARMRETEEKGWRYQVASNPREPSDRDI